MSCDWRRRKGWRRIAQATGLSAQAMEETFLRVKREAVGQQFSPEDREELASKTWALLGYLRHLGVTKLPVHGRSGLPRISSQVGFATVWEELTGRPEAARGQVKEGMNAPELIESLRALDRKLDAAFEAIVVGGAALVLCYGVERETRDVDMMLATGGAADKVREGIVEVARERGLKPGWLNDQVRMGADLLPADFWNRLVPLGMFGFRHLHLWAVGRPDLALLKLAVTPAPRDQDVEDLDQLLPTMSAEEWAVLIDNIGGMFRTERAQEMFRFLEARGWKAKR